LEDGTTLAGENAAVAPAGKPEAASVTLLVKGLEAEAEAN